MKYTGRQGWTTSYRDTFNLDCTLSPIICSALKKFKEVLIEKACKGIPSIVTQDLIDQGIVSYTDEDSYQLSEEDFDKVYHYYLDYIDQMIYAFDESEEPCKNDYDFSYETISGEQDKHGVYLLR